MMTLAGSIHPTKVAAQEVGVEHSPASGASGTARRRFVAVVLILAVAALAAGCSSDETPGGEAFDRHRAIVRITALGCGAPALGSGFAVDEHLIVTSGHLITGRTPESLGVIRPDGTEAAAVLVAFDQDFDLAALRVDDATFQPVTLLESEEGSGVAVAVRNPDDVEEIPFVIDDPVYVNWDGVFRDTESRFHGLRLDATIKRGDSGSGLFVSSQDVVGLVHSTNRAGLPRAYAVSAKQIREWLATVDDATEVDAPRCA